MTTTDQPQKFAPSNIDLKRQEISHISAWKDKEEFQTVFDLLYSSEPNDISALEKAIEALAVWKIRHGNNAPVSILCTLAISEVRYLDAKSQKDGKDNVNEIKSLYSGAFTKFINYLTEYRQQSGAGRKGSMANRVKEIGIEGFMVELRHMCAHSPLSIAIDVFRRSADYCMDWLKASYWERELRMIQSCESREIRVETIPAKHTDTLQYIAKIYDIATKATHRGAISVCGAQRHLTDSQFKLLHDHSQLNNVDQLKAMVFELVQHVEKMELPQHSESVRTVCDVFLNCQYMFEAPATEKTQGLARVHRRLIQTLVVKGYIQTFFEKLLEICEDDLAPANRRTGAMFWAKEIALAFHLLKRFKKLLVSLPERSFRFSRLEHTRKMSKSVRAIYQNKLRVDLQNTIIIGVSVNCPWHLRLSRSYVTRRVLNVNEYTKELLPIILTLAEPSLKLSQRENIEAAAEKYTFNSKATTREDGAIDDSVTGGVTSTPKRQQRKHEPVKPYSLDDVLMAAGIERNQSSAESAGNVGIWSPVSSEHALDWGKCPLGKLVWD